MQKKLAGVGLAFLLIFSFSFSFSEAATLTQEQIQAIISLVRSFGGSDDVLKNVEDSLYGRTPTTPPPPTSPSSDFCYTFTRYLKVGDQNTDVTNLVRALVREGLLDGDEVFQDGRTVLRFDDTIAAAIVGFQEKYGITRTGTVGPVTRAKLNSLYGCGNQAQPFITSVASMAAENGEIYSGEKVGIQGTNLLGNRDSTNVYIGGKVCTITQLGNTLVYCTAPSTLQGGSVYDLYINTVGVGGDKVTSNIVKVRVLNNTSQPAITVISPRDGEDWIVGSQYKIAWTDNREKGVPPRYVITLAGSNGKELIAENIYDPTHCKGSICYYDWQPSIPSTNNQISIYDVANDPNGAIIGRSYFFDIRSGSTKPSITVLSPSGGENYVLGKDSITIRWSPILPGVSTIQLVSSKGEKLQLYGQKVSGDPVNKIGYYTYKLPNNLSTIYPDTYFINLMLADGAFEVQSNKFSILSPGATVPPISGVYSIAGMTGQQTNYAPGAAIRFSVKGIESDGTPASQQEGFNVQAHLYNAAVGMNPSFQAVNGTYNISSGYWDVELQAPLDKSIMYEVKVSLYCGYVGFDSLCAQRYGTNSAQYKTFQFKIVDAISQPTLTASLTDQSYDFAGIWNNFGPGVGNGNPTKYDWHFTAALTLPSEKAVKYMEVIHSNGYEGWSTSLVHKIYGKDPYPLVVRRQEAIQLNSAYDQTFTLPGTSQFLQLYAQIESSTFSGGTLNIYFTDGTSVSAIIPANGGGGSTQPAITAFTATKIDSDGWNYKLAWTTSGTNQVQLTQYPPLSGVSATSDTGQDLAVTHTLSSPGNVNVRFSNGYSYPTKASFILDPLPLNFAQVESFRKTVTIDVPANAKSPVAFSFNPTSGVAGTKVTMYGGRFLPTGNDVAFVKEPGGPEFDINNLSSSDGKTLSFTIPNSTNVTGEDGVARTVYATPGQYYFVVTNVNGTSDTLHGFTITAPTTTAQPPYFKGTATGPATIQAGTAGTWSFSGGDPDGTSLTYSANWGDGAAVTSAQATVAPSISSTFTLNHTYQTAGSYLISFALKDAQGSSVSTIKAVQVTEPTTQTSATSLTPEAMGAIAEFSQKKNLNLANILKAIEQLIEAFK